jgi:CRISPR-associated protein Cas2
MEIGRRGKRMIIVSYDISNDKLRNHFSKFLCKFGRRLQYSVFEIENSEKILNNIISEIDNNYKKRFTQEDSVIIFKLSTSCKIIRYGYAKNEESGLVIIR